MKKFLSALALVLLIAPTTSQALSFSENTVFLDFKNEADCESKGGGYTEWYGEEYCTTVREDSFSDVNASHINFTAIEYVKQQGIVSGYPDGTFKPESSINRVELLKIVLEAGLPAEVGGCGSTGPGPSYPDVETGAWYQNDVIFASCIGFVGGYPDGTFKPANPVTVAEAAKIISNVFVHNITTTDGAWYEGFINNLAAKRAIPTTINSVGGELTRGQMAEMIYRSKTGKTNLASHTLTSLQEPSAVNTTEVDDELDTLFEDIFDEDGLDLDSLLDF